jgi:hypothetical protein
MMPWLVDRLVVLHAVLKRKFYWINPENRPGLTGAAEPYTRMCEQGSFW